MYGNTWEAIDKMVKQSTSLNTSHKLISLEASETFNNDQIEKIKKIN